MRTGFQKHLEKPVAPAELVGDRGGTTSRAFGKRRFSLKVLWRPASALCSMARGLL
jgi:hypothetical protein